ncbi:MAG TPA: hypothetical protein VEH77_09825, partial [Roseiarcus sp.]|nr:hypothetical protein [Roseiarcus sp.]
VFVTLSHVSGIVAIGVLASLGSAWLVPQRLEAYLAFATGALVVGLAAWMLWAQRELLALAMGEPEFAGHSHGHDEDHALFHDHGDGTGWHIHHWGTRHSHRVDLTAENRPGLLILLIVAVAGGILPDPAALAILLAALSSGKTLLGLATVLVFSLGFAATLVAVGLAAAQAGQRILHWLSGVWAFRIQIATTLLILGMGVVLTVRASYQLAAL